MPNDIKGSPIDIMKAISMFDTETDFDDTEAKEKLGILFHNIVMSEDPKAKEFLDRFLKQVDNVIADMGIIEKPEDEPEDEVDMPQDDELDMGDEEAPEEEIPVDEPLADEEPVDGTDGDDEVEVDEVPNDLLGAGYNRLLDKANSFLYF